MAYPNKKGNPYLDEQIKLFEHWGFEYKTLGFLWMKANKINGFPFFGVGFYSKSNAELCLLGIKGRMKPITNKISQVVLAPRNEHSAKPKEVRNKIVELFGDLPRIELFARQKTEDWDIWGNEIKNDIELG